MTILVSAAGGETHAPKIGRGGGREGYDLARVGVIPVVGVEREGSQ